MKEEDGYSRPRRARDVFSSIADLESITAKLSRYGTTVLSLIFIKLLILIMIIKIGHSFSDVHTFSIFLFDLLLFIITFLLLSSYESNRKRGNVLFEIISDELQWYIVNERSEINGSKSMYSEEKQARLKIEAGIALRSFTKTTDLPFVPGMYGPAIYIGINIVTTSSIFLLAARF